jgi:hypothetical protein
VHHTRRRARTTTLASCRPQHCHYRECQWRPGSHRSCPSPCVVARRELGFTRQNYWNRRIIFSLGSITHPPGIALVLPVLPEWHINEASTQAGAVDTFRAALEPLANSHTASVNVKDLTVALNLLVQLAPASQWGEAMHNSGLFAHIMSKVLDPKVCTSLLLTSIHAHAMAIRHPYLKSRSSCIFLRASQLLIRNFS